MLLNQRIIMWRIIWMAKGDESIFGISKHKRASVVLFCLWDFSCL